MAGFNLKSNLNEVEYKRVRVGSQAYTIGDAVMLDRTSDTVDVVPATASSTNINIFGVAMETVDNTATDLLIAVIRPGQTWECACTNATNENHDYQRMILTDKATVNNTGTDDTSVNAVVTQVGKTSSTKGLFTFNQTQVAA